MNLLEFIHSDVDAPVVLFCVKNSYPATFFNWFLSHTARMSDCHVIDFDIHDLQSIKSQIQVSFLGQARRYWLRNISEISAPMRTELFELLQTYQGPNILFFFAYETDVLHIPKSWCKVTIPDELDLQQCIAVINQIANVDHAYLTYVVPLLYKNRSVISFDHAFLILPYMQLIQGKHITDFMTSWADTLIPSESSLFVLSKLFFEKNGRAFFDQWKNIRDQYSLPFWTVFWSEQLWRAAWYVTIARQKNRAELKKISYRLPFSFVQHGWHAFSVRELKGAHDFVYSLDYATKNGGGTAGLELFFNQFFENRF